MLLLVAVHLSVDNINQSSLVKLRSVRRSGPTVISTWIVDDSRSEEHSSSHIHTGHCARGPAGAGRRPSRWARSRAAGARGAPCTAPRPPWRAPPPTPAPSRRPRPAPPRLSVITNGSINSTSPEWSDLFVENVLRRSYSRHLHCSQCNVHSVISFNMRQLRLEVALSFITA